VIDPMKRIIDDIGRLVTGFFILLGLFVFWSLFNGCTSCNKEEKPRSFSCTAEKQALTTCQGDLAKYRIQRQQAIDLAVHDARNEEEELCQTRIDDLSSGAENLQCELCCTFSLLPSNGGRSCE
jgi:hypothetical protein